MAGDDMKELQEQFAQIRRSNDALQNKRRWIEQALDAMTGWQLYIFACSCRGSEDFGESSELFLSGLPPHFVRRSLIQDPGRVVHWIAWRVFGCKSWLWRWG